MKTSHQRSLSSLISPSGGPKIDPELHQVISTFAPRDIMKLATLHRRWADQARRFALHQIRQSN